MRVLQIEDDAETAQTVTMILKSDGHDCDTADCGARALELAHDDELRAAGVTTPVVIQSGLVHRKNEVKGLGVEDCLAKPFGRRELRESLQSVIPGHSGHR